MDLVGAFGRNCIHGFESRMAKHDRQKSPLASSLRLVRIKVINDEGGAASSSKKILA